MGRIVACNDTGETFVNYNLYLQKSRHWARMKILVKHRDKKCQECGSKDNLVVHHLTYKHVGNEQMDELILLCADCHNLLHAAQKIASISTAKHKRPGKKKAKKQEQHKLIKKAIERYTLERQPWERPRSTIGPTVSALSKWGELVSAYECISTGKAKEALVRVNGKRAKIKRSGEAILIVIDNKAS